ncbi:GntR family transcriptional regulator [Catellatospora methionotrophica]|uniref:GntR family transcriptional regulator n=1 Tax=Catellatospora methionotrophica TaxID=121620 RepID=UPI0033EDE3B8
MSSTEIAADIAARIKTGEYPPGSRLPSYAQLREIYAPVSSATIARVIRDLRIQGTVVGSPGRGVYVPE